MQAGMLFEALLEHPSRSSGGFNVEQMHMVLSEELDADAFARAWTLIARRHPILSTGFRWDGLERPVQEVFPDLVVPIRRVPLAGATDDERRRALEAFLKADRAEGFDLRAPPLMRVSLLSTAPGRSEAVWTFHHILLDGRSFARVLSEVFTAYAALKKQETPELPPVPRPYSDFIDWLERLDLEESRTYFRSLLQGKATPTPLPVAEPAPRPLPREGYGELILAVDEPVRAATLSLARSTGTTLGTVVQAAWGLVLARYTGDEDVVFGTTRAGRRSALDGNTDEMVGLFINTVPIRVSMAGDRSVTEALADLRQQSLDLRKHEHMSLALIQAESEVPRGSRLFETLVMFENRELNATLRALGPEFHGREFSLHEQPSLPLNVTVFDGAHLEIRLLYDRRRFTDEAVRRLAESMSTALSALSADPDRKLRELEVIPEAELVRIVEDWNRTARPFPDELCIFEPFEARADLEPEAVAVEMNGKQLSYAELEARSNRLAHALRARGARPGTYVGICLERGPELVVAMLAVSKSGAAYLPLDHKHSQERLTFMLEDADALLVVTEQAHEYLFTCPAVVVDGLDSEWILEQPDTRLPKISSATDVCYVIFTSGSTGQPKGAVLTHRAVINTLDWVNRSFEVGPGDRLLFVTSPCFDLSVYDTFGALGAGATVVVADSRTLRDPALLAAAIIGQDITIWDSAPAALQQLVTFFPKSVQHSARLRLVMLSGDWIPLTLPDAVRSVFPKAQIRSLGGATEAAIWSNWFPVGELDPRWVSVPYGRPIQNSRYHVLDKRLRPVPVGVPGDLYIGGTCLANGYLNRHELTAERFIPDPLRPGTGERLYTTGDLARYFDSGDLEFLGRADFQVKIRGFRVELGEVEIALSKIAGMREAVCAAYVDPSGQKSLAAYVVGDGTTPLEEGAIKKWLAAKLPDFMVPSVVLVLPALPLSSNGKVDRKALPSPLSRATSDGYAAPRTQLEHDLVGIWERVLKRKPIGIHDDFFGLGGHSLLAVMLMSELRKELGIDVPLSSIIEHRTIASFAEAREPGHAAAETLAASPDETSLLQELRPGGPKHFFLIHDGDGETLLYLNLARRLPEEFAVIGVKPLSLPNIPLAHLTMREMAACYVEQIRKRQPNGPYYLGGLCAGGVIAFEMARLLGESSEVVSLVALLDAVEPTTPPKRFLIAKRRLERLLKRVTVDASAVSLAPSSMRMPNSMRSSTRSPSWPPRQQLRSVHAPTSVRVSRVSSIPPRPSSSGSGRPRPLATRVWKAARGAALAAGRMIRYEVKLQRESLSVARRIRVLRAVLDRGTCWPEALRPLSVRDIYMTIRDSYAPSPARIEHAVLVKATDVGLTDQALSEQFDDPLLGWGSYIDGRLEAVDSPGGHASMLQEPFVASVAEVLCKILNAESRIEGGDGSSRGSSRRGEVATFGVKHDQGEGGFALHGLDTSSQRVRTSSGGPC
jgi:amino acid adenylation domain-containing protein